MCLKTKQNENVHKKQVFKRQKLNTKITAFFLLFTILSSLSWCLYDFIFCSSKYFRSNKKLKQIIKHSKRKQKHFTSPIFFEIFNTFLKVYRNLRIISPEIFVKNCIQKNDWHSWFTKYIGNHFLEKEEKTKQTWKILFIFLVFSIAFFAKYFRCELGSLHNNLFNSTEKV